MEHGADKSRAAKRMWAPLKLIIRVSVAGPEITARTFPVRCLLAQMAGWPNCGRGRGLALTAGQGALCVRPRFLTSMTVHWDNKAFVCLPSRRPYTFDLAAVGMKKWRTNPCSFLATACLQLELVFKDFTHFPCSALIHSTLHMISYFSPVQS